MGVFACGIYQSCPRLARGLMHLHPVSLRGKRIPRRLSVFCTFVSTTSLLSPQRHVTALPGCGYPTAPLLVPSGRCVPGPSRPPIPPPSPSPTGLPLHPPPASPLHPPPDPTRQQPLTHVPQLVHHRHHQASKHPQQRLQCPFLGAGLRCCAGTWCGPSHRRPLARPPEATASLAAVAL